ncbi:5895_t:CDS:1, partial [Acaulospora colombiana]
SKASYSNPFVKREDYDKCVLAHAEFDNELVGLVTFVEKANETFIYGLFSRGLGCGPQFLITDNCGNVIQNVTDIFNVTLDGEGGTKPFFREVSCSVLDLGEILCTTCDQNKRELTTLGKNNTSKGVNLSVSSANSPKSTVPITPDK